jgi:hypothetical protein
MDFIRFWVSPSITGFGLERFQVTLNATCLLLAFWCLLSTAEWFARRRLFDEDGLLSWRVMSLRSDWGVRSPILARACGRRGVTAVLAIRFCCAGALTLPTGNVIRLVLLIAIVLTGILLRWRRWLSDDGSDQMGQIVAIGAAVMALGLVFHDPGFAFAGTLLIAGQLCIAYFVGGVAKLVSPEWRSGRALAGIMGTRSFGHRIAAHVANSSAGFSQVFCVSLIIIETAFPLAILANENFFCATLLIFALFHAATAIFMGLNTYSWAFVATYPSALILNALIATALGTGQTH